MLSGFKSAFLLVLTAVVVEAALGPEATLNIGHKDISPDGFVRNAVVVNDVTPGPLITAKKGQQFKLKVVNQLADPKQERGTSIHWHGLLQHGSNFMDGVAGVTQCPIAPGHSFEYSFTADHPGTFWYHSHFGLQYCDGLRGPIVVYDPVDPLRLFYDVDDESTIITLADWYHNTMADHHGILLPDSTLINGKGRIPGGAKVDLAVVNVQHGKRYRLRVLSVSCEPSFIFSVDNHDLQVIEVEGTSVWPVDVTNIQLLTAQRYSAVLKADQPIDNYWIRAIPNEGNLNLSTTIDGGVNAAILRYKGARISEPTTKPQQKPKMLKETDLHPMFDLLAPGKPTPNGADMTVNLTFGVDLNAFEFSVNGAVFQPPSVPILLQILSGTRDPRDILPSGSVITLPRNKVIQINAPSGLFAGPHPFHMHGHAFSVVRSADTGHFNFLNPVVRDVVNIGETEGDFVSIRFRTDNPGPWIFHCHIDFHLAVGLAIVFAEAPDQTAAADPPPASWKELCPIWDAEPDDVKLVSDGRPLP